MLKPPPGFRFEDRSDEQFLPNTSFSPHFLNSYHPSFHDQTQCHQTQSGIWDYYDNRPNPLTSNLPNVPTIPTNRQSSSRPPMAYPNTQIPTPFIQPNNYQVREPSFSNQNQAQFNHFLNPNNLPLSVPNFVPNVSNTFFLQPNHIVRPLQPQMPFLPDYSIPINYQTQQEAYLLQQQLMLKAAFNNSLFLAPYSPDLPTTTNHLLNNVQIRPVIQTSNSATFASERSQFDASNNYKNVSPQPPLKESLKLVDLTSNPDSEPSQSGVSTNCKSVSPQSLIEDNTSVVVTANPTKSDCGQSLNDTPEVPQDFSVVIMPEVRELKNMIRELSSSSTQINSESSTQTSADEPLMATSKEENIDVKSETLKESEGGVDFTRPEPALSPTSCGSEVKSIFKKERRTREKSIEVQPETLKKSEGGVDLNSPEPALSPTSCEVNSILKKERTGVWGTSSEETSPACALETRLSLANSSENLSEYDGRMSSLSLLSSSSDEDYASCAENTNRSPFPAPAAVPDSWEDQADSHSNKETVTCHIDEPQLDPVTQPQKRSTDISRPKSLDSSEPLVLNVGYKDLDFYIIKVNNRFAVLAYDFYPQVTKLPHYFCTKLMESNGREFHVIQKTTNPALLSNIEKMKFHPSVDKDTVAKWGKTQISYLSEIPEVLSIFGCENGNVGLLKKLKEFQEKNL